MSIQRIGGSCLAVAVTTITILILSFPNSTSSHDRLTAPPLCIAKVSQQAESNRYLSKQDIPRELYAISYCESRHRQYDQDGRPLRSRLGSRDIGRWQINIPTWQNKAQNLGYDLETEMGNYKMALWIYKNKGIDQWSASATCLERNFNILIK